MRHDSASVEGTNHKTQLTLEAVSVSVSVGLIFG